MKTVKLNDHKSIYSASVKLIAATILGAGAGLIAGLTLSWELAPLITWTVAAGSYVGYTWFHLLKYQPSLVKQHALREDPSQIFADGILLLASLASLAAVGLVVAQSSQSHGGSLILRALLCIIGVVVSWVVVHTVYALRYAEQYYGGSDSSVDFSGTKTPTYYDFAYLAFTIGMTYQVSDTTITGTTLRRTILKHAMLSYLFGSIIIATVVNLIAGLSH